MWAAKSVRGGRQFIMVSIAARSAIVASLLAMPLHTHAALKQWNNSAGGSVITPGNWNPNGIPAAGDDLDFSLVATYPLTFASPVTASNSFIVHRGNITITLNNTHTSNALWRIGDSGETCSITITTGTMQSAVNAILGNGPSGTGTVNVNDADATFQTTSATSDINVGHAGGGIMNLTNGGQVVSSDDILIANMAATTGTVTVNGFNVGAAQASRMRTTAAEGDMLVGFNGTGILHIQAGGNVTSSDDLFCAPNSAAVGTINVGGFGLTNSTLTVTDALDIACNNTANAAGIGTLNINADGLVTVGGLMRIDDPNGGTGRLNITGGTLNVTSSITSLGDIKLAGGSLSASSLMLGSGLLSGAGTINAPTDATSATLTIRPGVSTVPSPGVNAVGTLNFGSTYTQNGAASTGALLEMEIGGGKKPQYDRLVASGPMSLGGTLRVLLINAYVPQVDDEYTIITGSSVSGTFDAVELPELSPGRAWELTYNAKNVLLRVIFTGTCEGDATGDSIIDIDDLLLVIGAWGAVGASPGDINANGTVDIDDLLRVIGAWGACP